MRSSPDTDSGSTCLGFAAKEGFLLHKRLAISMASLKCMSASESARKVTETWLYVH